MKLLSNFLESIGMGKQRNICKENIHLKLEFYDYVMPCLDKIQSSCIQVPQNENTNLKYVNEMKIWVKKRQCTSSLQRPSIVK